MIKKGDVLICNLGAINGCKGSVQRGEARPCIVVSNNISNKTSPVITVVPLTTQIYKKFLPTHFVYYKDLGGSETTVALCEQITTIDKSQIIRSGNRKIPEYMLPVLDKRIKVALGIW